MNVGAVSAIASNVTATVTASRRLRMVNGTSQQDITVILRWLVVTSLFIRDTPCLRRPRDVIILQQNTSLVCCSYRWKWRYVIEWSRHGEYRRYGVVITGGINYTYVNDAMSHARHRHTGDTSRQTWLIATSTSVIRVHARRWHTTLLFIIVGHMLRSYH